MPLSTGFFVTESTGGSREKVFVWLGNAPEGVPVVRTLNVYIATDYKTDTYIIKYQDKPVRMEKINDATEKDIEKLSAEILEEYTKDPKVLGIQILSSDYRYKNIMNRCPSCSTFFIDGKGKSMDRYSVCLECARTKTICSFCGLFMTITEKSISKRGYYACESCQKLYSLCPTCGSWRDIERTDKHCPECSIKISLTSSEDNSMLERYRSGLIVNVHDHSHRPDPLFYPDKDITGNTLYLGVELEVDNFRITKNSAGIISQGAFKASETIHAIDPYEKLMYLKYDGSIRKGFEIVTHPCTMLYHTTQFPWNDIRKACISNGGRSHETTSCGLHVHFNSNFFGTPSSEPWNINVLKLLNISNHFWGQIVKFSRRDMQSLNEYAARYREDFKVTKDNMGKIKELGGTGRYRAINLSHPSTTLEIRLFKGTLNDRTLFATFQFVDHLVNWAKKASVEDVNDITWEKFVETIDRKQCPELIEYLVRRKLCAS